MQTSIQPMMSTRRVFTEKGEATRSRIVASAADRFVVSGVARTSLDDVGRAAAVGKSQIYHYFADKSALVEAVLDLQASRVLDEQQSEREPLDSWESWNRWRSAAIERQLSRSCRGGCPLGSLANEMAELDERARLSAAQSFDDWEGVFRAGIVAMRESGLLRPETDADALATVILALVQGGLLLCKVRRSTAPLKVALDGSLSLLRQHELT